MARKPKRPETTPAEFGVLKALWRLGRGGTVAEVRAQCHAMQGSEPAYTTVMTLLGRLAQKGAVKVDRAQEPFVYIPAYREQNVLAERLKRFIDTVFDGRPSELVLSLLESEALSPEDLRRIERKIASADGRAPKGKERRS
jgi:predicted transcriptional regulator